MTAEHLLAIQRRVVSLHYEVLSKLNELIDSQLEVIGELEKRAAQEREVRQMHGPR